MVMMSVRIHTSAGYHDVTFEIDDRASVRQLAQFLMQRYGLHPDRLECREPGGSVWWLLDSTEPVVQCGLSSGYDVRAVESTSEAASREQFEFLKDTSKHLVQRSAQFLNEPIAPRFTLPRFSKKNAPSQFPLVALLSSVGIGIMSMVMTGSPMGLMFLALGPVLYFGQYFIGWFRRIRFPWRRKAIARIMDALILQLDRAQHAEQHYHEQLNPQIQRLIRGVERRQSLLWQGSGNESISLRLGTAAQPSQIVKALRQQLHDCLQRLGWFAEVEPGDSLGHNIPSQLMKNHPELGTILELCAEREQFSLPYVMKLERHRHYGLVIPNLIRQGATIRGLILGLALRYPPQELNIKLSGLGAPAFSEIHWLPHVVADGGGSALHTLQIVVAPDAHERAQILNGVRSDTKQTVLWVVEHTRQLPPETYEYWELGHERVHHRCQDSATGSHVTQFRSVEVSPQEFVRHARRLAPLLDADQLATVQQELPATVSHIARIEGTLQSERVTEEWRMNARDTSLKAPVAHDGSGTVWLDLVAEGPHALIAGTTGSGKSEFFQSWLLSLALRYAPQQLSFLLVDFKGGATFRPLSSLPHSVGFITDITELAMNRVFSSLLAELRRRELLFEQNGAHSIDEYRARFSAPLSRLVVAIDEFAALLEEHPEFAEVLTGIAARGRSLGVHVILATQRPTGVVGAQLAANLGLRIAFRTADATESRLIIDHDAAAKISPEHPGRAIIQRSQHNLQLVQMMSLSVPQTPTIRVVKEFGSGVHTFGLEPMWQPLAALRRGQSDDA